MTPAEASRIYHVATAARLKSRHQPGIVFGAGGSVHGESLRLDEVVKDLVCRRRFGWLPGAAAEAFRKAAVKSDLLCFADFNLGKGCNQGSRALVPCGRRTEPY